MKNIKLIKKEKILRGITYNAVQFCVSSVVSMYLSYYKIDLMADIVGKYWTFIFGIKKRDFFDNKIEEYVISPIAKTYANILKKEYGFFFENIVRSKEKKIFIEDSKKYLDLGYPLIVNADPYYFENYENYYKFHGLNWNHYILVIGYSDLKKEFMYIDSTRVFVQGAFHKISYEDLYQSIFSKVNVYSIEPEIVILRKPDMPNFQKESKLVFQQVEQPLACLSMYYGYQALEEFAKALRKISKINSDQLQYEYLDNILSQVVFVVQHRKANLIYYEKNIEHSDTLRAIVQYWNMVKFSLSPIRKKENRCKFLDAADYLAMIAELERRFENEIRE